MKAFLPFAAIAVLAGCATSGQHASQPRTITYEQASAFENSLLARQPITHATSPMLYVQPINKKEACKLPTTQNQLDRGNFRAYWDGDCKNGFAFGLGRDIAISDTHHIEEIIVHNGRADDWSGPKVDYDYVNNVVHYAVGGPKAPAATELAEKFENAVSGFNAYYNLVVTDESGNALVLQTSAFNPEKIYLYNKSDGLISYKFIDHTAAPSADQNATTFTAEVVDPQRKATGGAAIVSYANGSVRDFLLVNGRPELTSFPVTYADHLRAKYQAILDSTSQAHASLQAAYQIEREYLFKACNGKSGIDGMDNTSYTKICTWRDEFKKPYAVALANYQEHLESVKQQATTAQQQHQVQQQIALQQQMLRQQQNQQTWNEVNQASQQLQQRTQQILQGVNSWQAPRAQPITPPGGTKVICHTIGSITTCQ